MQKLHCWDSLALRGSSGAFSQDFPSFIFSSRKPHAKGVGDFILLPEEESFDSPDGSLYFCIV